jgi:hypothetical protein
MAYLIPPSDVSDSNRDFHEETPGALCLRKEYLIVIVVTSQFECKDQDSMESTGG